MSRHNWLPLSPNCMDCGAYRRGEEAGQPCPGNQGEVDHG